MSVPDQRCATRWTALTSHAYTHTHIRIPKKSHFIILRLNFIIKTVKLDTNSKVVKVAYLIFI